MRKLPRRLFTLLSAVSMLACVAVVVLWAWPHAAGRAVRLSKGEYETGEYETWIAPDGGGRFVLEVSPYAVAYPVNTNSTQRTLQHERAAVITTAASATSGPLDVTVEPLPTESLNSLLPSDSGLTFGSAFVVLPSERRPFPGVRWIDNVMRGTGQITSRHVTVACWLPALAFAVLPTVWLVRHRRQAHRPRAGECRACGYDLRASPERCPECGAVAVSSVNGPKKIDI